MLETFKVRTISPLSLSQVPSSQSLQFQVLSLKTWNLNVTEYPFKITFSQKKYTWIFQKLYLNQSQWPFLMLEGVIGERLDPYLECSAGVAPLSQAPHMQISVAKFPTLLKPRFTFQNDGIDLFFST